MHGIGTAPGCNHYQAGAPNPCAHVGQAMHTAGWDPGLPRTHRRHLEPLSNALVEGTDCLAVHEGNKLSPLYLANGILGCRKDSTAMRYAQQRRAPPCVRARAASHSVSTQLVPRGGLGHKMPAKTRTTDAITAKHCSREL